MTWRCEFVEEERRRAQKKPTGALTLTLLPPKLPLSNSSSVSWPICYFYFLFFIFEYLNICFEIETSVGQVKRMFGWMP